MAIKSKDLLTRPKKIEIDLTSSLGNAYVLMGIVKDYLKQLGKDRRYIDNILAEMKSSDYENLIKVFDRELGEYIDLFR